MYSIEELERIMSDGFAGVACECGEDYRIEPDADFACECGARVASPLVEEGLI